MLVGAVFLSEGIQKFLFPAELGVGRFGRIGSPRRWVGGIAIICGELLIVGVLTRVASLLFVSSATRAVQAEKRTILDPN